MSNHKIMRIIFLLTAFLLEALFISFIVSFLPPAMPVQAAATLPPSDNILQSSTTYTTYVPIVIRRLPTPEEKLIALINTERSQRGINPVQVDPLLMQMAENHSYDMVNRKFFSHTNPDGDDPGDRLDNIDYDWLTYGENIGGGQKTAQDIFDAWMDSPGHRDNLLNPHLTEIGIGYGVGGPYGHYWTAILAKPTS